MRIVAFIMLACFYLNGCQGQQSSVHLEEVAERGAEVMGFDLERSTHIFDKIENGGRQQVISDDDDPEQIVLIREHMSEIYGQFSVGNFHGPETIHGEHMPGLHELVMGHDKINIEYSELEKGGQILYTTEDEKMVEAIHAWFDAQVSDHGHHAQGHH